MDKQVLEYLGISEADAAPSAEPALYVGTYRKYNGGSIAGKWLKLTNYKTFEEFNAACYALHSDESDPELMFQDFDNMPFSFSTLDEITFDLIIKVYKEDKTKAFEAYLSYYGQLPEDRSEIYSDFEDKFEGAYDSEKAFGEQLADDTIDGLKGDSILARYFDYEAYTRDLFLSDFYFENGFVFRR